MVLWTSAKDRFSRSPMSRSWLCAWVGLLRLVVVTRRDHAQFPGTCSSVQIERLMRFLGHQWESDKFVIDVGKVVCERSVSRNYGAFAIHVQNLPPMLAFFFHSSYMAVHSENQKGVRAQSFKPTVVKTPMNTFAKRAMIIKVKHTSYHL